jgi:hypothetical protein
VHGRTDQHGPFVLDGEFDDETLLRVVALIRSSPAGPPLSNGEANKINGSLRISRVRRTDSGLEVTLNRDAYHGEYVTLEDRNGRFVVVKHRTWIV